MILQVERDLSAGRRVFDVPPHVVELMRAWERSRSFMDTRSMVGDPGQIWGRVLTAVGRPGPAGAPIEDLIVYLRDETRRWSSAMCRQDRSPAVPAIPFHADAIGADRGIGDSATSPVRPAGTRHLSGGGRNRPQVVGRAVTSDPAA